MNNYNVLVVDDEKEIRKNEGITRIGVGYGSGQSCYPKSFFEKHRKWGCLP